jgi:DNA-binding transcriptional LysR family regulator
MDHRYRKFLAVAETGSFSAAAKQLHVTQPAITIAVASLEHSLGVKLYIRRRAPIELTSEGRVVVETARIIAREDAKLRTALRSEQPRPQRQIGLIDSVAHLLYSTPTGRTLLGNVEVMVDNSRRILREIADGTLEMGVITGQPMPLGPDMTVRKLHNEEFVFVTSPEHTQVARTGRIDDWLATNRDSTSYQYFTQQFLQKGLQVTPVFYSASMELLRDMALAGKGTALLPRHIVRDALENGSLKVVKTKPLFRPIWVVTRSGDRSTVAAKSFAVQASALLAAE